MNPYRELPGPGAIGALDAYKPRPYYPAEKQLQVRDLMGILARRRNIVLATALVFLVLGAIYCAIASRRYQATATLQVGNNAENNLGLQVDGSQQGASDSLSESVTLQTQAAILQSDTLALKVIQDLNLESTKDFHKSFDPIGFVVSTLGLGDRPESPSLPIEDSPRRRARVLDIFSKNLDVKPVAGTRLVEISYLSTDPKLAAEVVNHLANSLVDYNFQIRHDATSHTAEWLAGQMADLRKQSEDLQSKVAQLQHESGVFSLGESDLSGREQVYSSVLDKLQQSTTALSQAQAARIGKAAIYQIVQSSDPEAISQLGGNSIFASSSGMESSLSLIQSMRMQEATLRGQVGEMAAKFGPDYPKLKEARAHVDAIESSIHNEVKRIAERAKNDYAVAKSVEDNARKVYLDQKHQADLVNDKTIEYTIARKEAEESRNLYESLFRQLKQAGVLAGFRASNISVVDPGRIPSKPARPKVLLSMAIALAAGLMLGGAMAFAKDSVDTRINSLESLEAEFGLIPFGVLPFYKAGSSIPSSAGYANLEGKVDGRDRGVLSILSARKKPAARPKVLTGRSGQKLYMPAVQEPRAPFVEALRALRTSLFLSKNKAAPQTLLITSSLPGEGKTTISTNFAAVLADSRKKVLLIDADLRHPNLHRALSVTSAKGLSWLLQENFAASGQTLDVASMSVVVPASDIPGLFVVPSGRIPEHPAELLSSERMREALAIWRTKFDYIVIDGPPILPVTDAVILSGLADFTLLTARFKGVEQQALSRAYSILSGQCGHSNIGVVFNGVEESPGVYYGSYGYAPPTMDGVSGRRSRETA